MLVIIYNLILVWTMTTITTLYEPVYHINPAFLSVLSSVFFHSSMQSSSWHSSNFIVGGTGFISFGPLER